MRTADIRKRILFRVDANQNIGWGHFYRSMALANMLKDDFAINFAIAAPNPDIIKVLPDEFNVIELEEKDYQKPDFRGDIEFKFDLAHVLDDFDILVLDGYWFGQDFCSEARKRNVKIVQLEDTGGGNFISDLVINQAENLNVKDYNLDSSTPKFCLGLKYALLREEFLNNAKNDQDYSRERNSVLVCFGGSDSFNKTLSTSKWILENTERKVLAVVGGSYTHLKNLDELSEVYSDRFQLRHNLNTEQMLAVMKEAELAVLPTSGIMIEAIASRLPVIGGVYANNQVKIYQGLLQKKLLIDGGRFEPHDLEYAFKIAKHEKFIELEERYKLAVDGKSGNRFREAFKAL